MKEKKIFRLILLLTGAVIATVIMLNKKVFPSPAEVPFFVQFLPGLNAVINATCFLLLLLSFYFIRKKKIQVHKKINLATFCLSSLFLLSYITFHYFAEETKFPASNPLRPFYLVLLSSHIILAAIVLPLVLLSFYRGLNMQIPAHRKIVRWAFPVWLYVTATGVLVYFMIAPYYKF